MTAIKKLGPPYWEQCGWRPDVMTSQGMRDIKSCMADKERFKERTARLQPIQMVGLHSMEAKQTPNISPKNVSEHFDFSFAYMLAGICFWLFCEKTEKEITPL